MEKIFVWVFERPEGLRPSTAALGYAIGAAATPGIIACVINRRRTHQVLVVAAILDIYIIDSRAGEYE
jgi:hypothetical protein